MQKIIISACRTKDLVRTCPDLLADMLEGSKGCSLTGKGLCRLSLDDIGALVFWTKTPFNILGNQRLKDVLVRLVKEHHGLVYLHMTVTGYGNTFVEYDIPGYETLPEFLSKCFAEGILFPDAVTVRYDPVFELNMGNGRILSNMQVSVFRDVVDKFAAIGIKRVSTARIRTRDTVMERIISLGLKPIDPGESMLSFVTEMDQVCKEKGVEFSTCSNPGFQRFGCIDGVYLNKLTQTHFPGSDVVLDTRLHNDVGTQRGDCHCSYSHDIAYSSGTRMCYPQKTGCIYCYAQLTTGKAWKGLVQSEIDQFKLNPEEFVKKNPQYKKLMVEKPYAERQG